VLEHEPGQRDDAQAVAELADELGRDQPPPVAVGEDGVARPRVATT
jgi:hypothetical protein